MNIRPLGSDLIVRRDTPPEQTRGGIVIPTISKEQQLYAIVVAVGPEVCVVQVGDRVILEDWRGEKVEVDGEEFTVVPLMDVAAVVSDV